MKRMHTECTGILVQGGLVLTLARRESLSVDCNKETLKCSSSGWLLHRISGHNHRFSSQRQVAQALTGNTSSREKWRVGKLAHGPLGDRCPRADTQPTAFIVRRSIKALHSPTATSKGYGCLVRMHYSGGPVSVSSSAALHHGFMFDDVLLYSGARSRGGVNAGRRAARVR
jgi:hypothetical protein